MGFSVKTVIYLFRVTGSVSIGILATFRTLNTPLKSKLLSGSIYLSGSFPTFEMIYCRSCGVFGLLYL